MTQPPVILLHGFLRTGLAMLPMARVLRESGRATSSPTFVYQTEGLEAASARLAQLIREMGQPVDLVTHSFGGLLARATLPKASIRRVVMLAPPNQGAQKAAIARKLLPFHYLGWDPLAPMLPGAPASLPQGPAEIAVLAGGVGRPSGLVDYLEGDNDRTVRVVETHLAGAKVHRVLEVNHTFIIGNAQAQALTLAFLERGELPD
ncbi:MAG: triacylglycerol lipase [Cognaticolwellia sp.]